MNIPVAGPRRAQEQPIRQTHYLVIFSDGVRHRLAQSIPDTDRQSAVVSGLRVLRQYNARAGRLITTADTTIAWFDRIAPDIWHIRTRLGGATVWHDTGKNAIYVLHRQK